MAKRRNSLGSLKEEIGVSQQAKSTLLSAINNEEEQTEASPIKEEKKVVKQEAPKIVPKVEKAKSETTEGKPINMIKEGSRRKKFNAHFNSVENFRRGTPIFPSEGNKRKLNMAASYYNVAQSHFLDNVITAFFEQYEQELREDGSWDFINR